MPEFNEQNPYRAAQGEPSDPSISNEPSIEFEPHLQPEAIFPADESERDAGYALATSTPSETDPVDHTVWDEPGISPQLVGSAPQDALTYSRWLTAQMAATTLEKSWLVTLAIVACAGLFAAGGSMVGAFNGPAQGIILVCIVGPLSEEVMKVALAFWVIEKRPYLFKSSLQIGACAVAGGLLFAVVENLLYLNVYLPDPTLGLIAWRWSVCVLLHVCCSLIAGVGLIRIWSDCVAHRHRPRPVLGSSMMVTAIMIHAIYNTVATATSMIGF